MAELTKKELQDAFIEVLTDKSLMTEVMRAACVDATKAIIREAFGFDPTDPAHRAEMLQDMTWLRESREGIALKEAELDHMFVRKFRNTLEAAIWRVGYLIVMGVLAFAVYILGSGVRPDLLK